MDVPCLRCETYAQWLKDYQVREATRMGLKNIFNEVKETN